MAFETPRPLDGDEFSILRRLAGDLESEEQVPARGVGELAQGLHARRVLATLEARDCRRGRTDTACELLLRQVLAHPKPDDCACELLVGLEPLPLAAVFSALGSA